MDYVIETLSETMHQVAFADGRKVMFVVKPGDNLQAQISAYLNPPPVADTPAAPAEESVVLHALKMKMVLTDEDITTARQDLMSGQQS